MNMNTLFNSSNRGFIPLIIVIVLAIGVGYIAVTQSTRYSDTSETNIVTESAGDLLIKNDETAETQISDSISSTTRKIAAIVNKVVSPSPEPAAYTAGTAWSNQLALQGRTITIEDVIDFEYHCPDEPGADPKATPCTSRPVLGTSRTLNPSMTYGSNLYVGTSTKNPPYTECVGQVSECQGWKKGSRYQVNGVLRRPDGVGVAYFDVLMRTELK